MQYRHEWKHEISIFDVLCLRQRLSSVMTPDPHARGGRYFVRSLYFDDLRDTALREKLDGVSRREKFRLRCYNGDDSYLVLEKKSKVGGLCAKEQTCLTRPQAQALLVCDFEAPGRRPRTPDAGAAMEDAHPGPAAQNYCGLYPGALCLCPRQCPGDAGL